MAIHEGPLGTDLTDSEFSTGKRQGVVRMMNWLRSIRLLPLWRVAFLWLALAPAASAVMVLDWVTVGDPGNACDPQSQGCFGAVAESYRISRFEVTNAQYAEFLNAVATTDANGLYHVNMGSVGVADFGGITQIGVRRPEVPNSPLARPLHANSVRIGYLSDVLKRPPNYPTRSGRESRPIRASKLV